MYGSMSLAEESLEKQVGIEKESEGLVLTVTGRNRGKLFIR